jgi:hypothetical protein
MGLSAKIKASVTGTLSSANDMGVASFPFSELFELVLTNGTGADQGNNAFMDERTLAASTSEELDLAGVLSNVFGAVLAAAAVKAILVIADQENTNNVVIGGAAANAFVGPFADATDKLVLGPGDAFLITRRSAAGMAVTGGTGDKLQIANSGAGSPVTYRIVLVLEA